MKKSRFTEDQMVTIQRQANRAPMPEVARKRKASVRAIYTLRRRFGEVQPTYVRRLRQLASENTKLKMTLLRHDIVATQIIKPQFRREMELVMTSELGQRSRYIAPLRKALPPKAIIFWKWIELRQIKCNNLARPLRGRFVLKFRILRTEPLNTTEQIVEIHFSGID